MRGDGHNTIVEYMPGASWMQKSNDGSEVLQRSDAVLFHEMVHAHHRTNGTHDPRIVGQGLENVVPLLHGNDMHLHASEYQTTGLAEWGGQALTENQYRRERAARGDDIGVRTHYSPVPSAGPGAPYLS